MISTLTFKDRLARLMHRAGLRRCRVFGETLNEYVARYHDEAESGRRRTQKGTRFSPGTIKSIKMAMVQLEGFQKWKGRVYGWDEIDFVFRATFLDYLYEVRKYNVNSAAKCINTLVTIMAAAHAEGYHGNTVFLSRKFKARRIEVDNVYLTKEELERFRSVDLSGLPALYEHARDIFLVGVYTAQRVSDYNYIDEKNIIRSDGGEMVISLRQKKTGVWVSIPVKKELEEILRKYELRLPHVVEQTFNRYIKVVVRQAGIDEPVTVRKSRCGVPMEETKPKYELVHSHTARRTGATLMFLAGMNPFNICAMTGHSSIAMLRRYIKADKLERARLIRSDEGFARW